MIKLKHEDVTYSMAVPARKRDIALWLITGGQKGKLFIRNDKELGKWMHPEKNTPNCRILKNQPTLKPAKCNGCGSSTYKTCRCPIDAIHPEHPWDKK